MRSDIDMQDNIPDEYINFNPKNIIIPYNKNDIHWILIKNR